MKVEIPEEILELSKEMNKQNNRSTALPLYIVVGDEKRYGDSSYCDNKERTEEPNEEDLCEDCLQLLNSDDYEGTLPEDCDDCMSEAFHWYKIEEHVPQMQHGVFLTGEACDEYIKRRSYEMQPNACSYGISSYWSYDMTKALKFLSSLTTPDGEPSNNYK